MTTTTSAAPDIVWELLSDFASIDFFNPHVSRSFLLPAPDGPIGEGTLRQCDLNRGGGFIRERITEWREGESYEVEIYEHRLPVTDLFTRMGVTPDSGGGSIIFMQSRYRPRFGLLGKELDWLVLRFVFRHMFRGVVRGLVEKAEERERTVLHRAA